MGRPWKNIRSVGNNQTYQNKILQSTYDFNNCKIMSSREKKTKR